MTEKKKKPPIQLQSAKLWHEGESWFLIVSSGRQGETSERGKFGPFDNLDETIKSLVGYNKDLEV